MPRREMDRLQGEIEELFADLWQVPRFTGRRRGFRPAVDCFLTADPSELVVVVELAGVDPGSLEIAVEQRALNISGLRNRPRVPGQVYQQAEIDYGPFERHVALEYPIDPAGASASYENGLLRIALPVAKRPRSRRPVAIVVRTSG
jgi:HSP20 family protein